MSQGEIRPTKNGLKERISMIVNIMVKYTEEIRTNSSNRKNPKELLYKGCELGFLSGEKTTALFPIR